MHEGGMVTPRSPCARSQRRAFTPPGNTPNFGSKGWHGCQQRAQQCPAARRRYICAPLDSCPPKPAPLQPTIQEGSVIIGEPANIWSNVQAQMQSRAGRDVGSGVGPQSSHLLAENLSIPPLDKIQLIVICSRSANIHVHTRCTGPRSNWSAAISSRWPLHLAALRHARIQQRSDLHAGSWHDFRSQESSQ